MEDYFLICLVNGAIAGMVSAKENIPLFVTIPLLLILNTIIYLILL